jgi:hypothetical protein
MPMTLLPTYSRRKRQAAGQSVDVYQYDQMSSTLRQQLLYAIDDARSVARIPYDTAKMIPETVVGFVRRELGVPVLAYGIGPEEEFSSWFLTLANLDRSFDALEVYFQIIRANAVERGEVDRQIEVANARMREAGFGFQLVDGEIIRVADQHAHSEIVVPALTLLSQGRFPAANDEYRKAHQEYRAGEYADCITDCGKALESVLKVIAGEKGWTEVGDTSTLSALLKAAKDNGLYPGYMDEQINGLTRMLQGPGTVRNKDGAHGVGGATSNADENLASYQLHQTAAAILFLAKQP